MNRNTSSYLSSSVRHLLRLSFENCRDTSLNNQALQCLRKEGQVLVFEDQPIQCLLGNVIIDDYSQRTGQWYKSVLRRLSHDIINHEPFKKDPLKIKVVYSSGIGLLMNDQSWPSRLDP